MPKIFVGMSGGIDSSVAAYLLKEEGHEVTGITFVGPNEEGSKKCCSYEEVVSAAKVCDFLGIKHKIINLKDIFEAKIISYFIESYKNGLTPNPCVFCNRYIKFGSLLEYAISEDAEFFATGHYARLVKINDELLIKRGLDKQKDQSYFISFIEKEKLPFIKLPLGNYRKDKIKKIAAKANLPVDINKPESQDICFVKDDYRIFLKKRGVKEESGDFILDGKVIGKHIGIPFYSFGQRRGLNIAVGERKYVRGFNLKENQIIIGNKPFIKSFNVRELNIFSNKFSSEKYKVQFRYQSMPENCVVELNHDKKEALVHLNKPRELVTPGQFAVFYKNHFVYAAGIIEKIEIEK